MAAVVLSVGESHHLRVGKDHIVYAGMPSEKVFSIAQRKWEFYHGFAWNLFFPREQTELTIDGVSLTVESVTPQEIRLRV
jgi:riboflavin synthase alpha subunit